MSSRKLLVLLIPFFTIAFASCEDVIEVEVPEEDPRLNVEGLIRVDTTEEFLPIEIKLSTTTPFFDEFEPLNEVEEITIIIQVFDEEGNSQGTGTSVLGPDETRDGYYIPVVIEGDVDERVGMGIIEFDALYTLVITWKGRRYAAQTRYVPAVPITEASFGENTLFEEDETEVIVQFEDNPEPGNYYIFDFGAGEYLPSEDEFYNGQEFEFSYFVQRELSTSEPLELKIFGADQTFYNYMLLLTEQSGLLENPFQVPVATVRGNVFDVTELDNIENFDNAGSPMVFPLGYFAIVQEFEYTVPAN